MEKLYIISNESIFEENGNFFCDNIDLKSTPEGLNNYFDIILVGRKSIEKRKHKIKIQNIKCFKSIFSFLLNVIKASKDKNSKYLFVSISPFTFLAAITLRLCKKVPIVYLRSDGHEEYKVKYSYFGFFIYYLMFFLISKISKLIACRDTLLKKNNGDIVFPSQLNDTWFDKIRSINFERINLLYVGRLKKEKGIFSLIDLLKNSETINLTIIGAEKGKNYNFNYSNIIINEIEENTDKLIQYYDNSNIFVLPSFTEGHPMVLLEALARQRPVIIFEDIKYVSGDRKGIFVSKRNKTDLLKTIEFIKKNYIFIQAEMKKNILPTNFDFIKNLSRIIESY